MLRRLSNVSEIEAGPALDGDISGAVGRMDEGRAFSFEGAFVTAAASGAGEAFVGVDAGAAATVVVGGPIEIAGIAGRDRGPPPTISMGLVTTTAGDAAGAAVAAFAAADLAGEAGDWGPGDCGAAAAAGRCAGARCWGADGPNTFCFCDSGCAGPAG
jgi:hypothetical protein